MPAKKKAKKQRSGSLVHKSGSSTGHASAGVLSLGPINVWLPRAFVATAAAAVSVYFLLGYSGGAPAFVAPIIAGVIAGLIAGEVTPAAAAGGLGGLVAGVMATQDFTYQSLVSHFEAAPAYTNPDVLQTQLYRDFLLRLVQANPANATVAPGPAVTIGLALILTAAVAGVTALILRVSANRDLVETVAGWTVVCTLALIFIMTSWTYAAAFRDSLERELPVGGYAYDAFIYQRTYQEMLKGSGYYQGLLTAASGDKRLIDEKAVINNKFYSWVYSPTLAREPGAFYLWRFAAPNGPPGVFLLALLSCAAVMLLMHWGLRRFSLAASLIAPVLLLPMFMFLCVWENIFFPDFWGSMVMLASLAFLLRKQLIAAAALALVAALFRETMVLWLIALLVLSALRARSSKHGMRDMAIVGGLFAVFVGMYALHYYQANQIIAAEANTGAGGFLGRLMTGAQQTLEGKFLAPLSYMMWPYGFFRFPGAFVAVLGAIGYGLSFADQPSLRWTVTGYAAFWLLFYATLGATSSYWGQHVLPFYLVGVALLLASASFAAEKIGRSQGVSAS